MCIRDREEAAKAAAAAAAEAKAKEEAERKEREEKERKERAQREQKEKAKKEAEEAQARKEKMAVRVLSMDTYRSVDGFMRLSVRVLWCCRRKRRLGLRLRAKTSSKRTWSMSRTPTAMTHLQQTATIVSKSLPA